MQKNTKNKQAVLEAVSKNGEALKNFPEFQNDRDVVWQRLQNEEGFRFASALKFEVSFKAARKFF